MGDGQMMSSKGYPPKIILARLNEFRKEGKFCDVKIVVGDSEFLAHKVILAAFSSYLEGIFSNGYSGMRHFILELNCVEASLVDILLEYVYTTEIEFSESNVSGLLHLAKFFKAVPLFESCCRFMEDNFNAENCIAYYKLALSYSCISLKEKSLDCIRKNFSKVCRENEFLELPAENVWGILNFCALYDQSPEFKDAALRWYDFKRRERSDDILTILQSFSEFDISGKDRNLLACPAEDCLICQE